MRNSFRERSSCLYSEGKIELLHALKRRGGKENAKATAQTKTSSIANPPSYLYK